MAPSRTQLRKRSSRTYRDLPADARRVAGPTSALSIDGRAVSLQVGDRLLGAVLERTIEGANTLSVELWDGDRRVLTSGVLGRRVMTRAAEVTVDGLTYTVAGLSRSGDTLTVTCEDATITVLKRHRPKQPLNTSRGRMTRAQAAATAVRRAGVPVVVLDELVVQPIKGARKLRDELKAAKRDTSAQASTGRSSTIKVNAAGLEFNGRPATKAQRRNVGLAIEAARETKAGPKATLALFMACIVEPGGYKGSGPFDNPTGGDRDSQGILQARVDMHGLDVATSVKKSARKFLTTGWTGGGGAIEVARRNPGLSAGLVAAAVQAPDARYVGRYDEVRGQALAAIKAAGGGGGASGGDAGAASGSDPDAYVERYAFIQRRGETTYAFVRRLLDEVKWRVFVREGVVVIASEPALARAVPSLVLDEKLLEQDDFEQHRALRAGEASLQAYVGAYDADPGETVLVDTLPQLSDANWLIASSRVDLLEDVPLVDIAVRLPQKPSAEPASTVKTRPGDPDTDEAATGSNESGGGGAQAAVKWARSKVGFKETGFNSGGIASEANRQFGMSGQPWCAMFTSIAATKGGAPAACRTASVEEVTKKARAGQGYQRGFIPPGRAKPGDLICFGFGHIGMISGRTSGGGLKMIAGNDSDGVQEREATGSGPILIARPKYRD